MPDQRLKIVRKDWESNFFGTEYFTLKLPDTISRKELTLSLPDLISTTPDGLIECNLDTSLLPVADVLEDQGFRLVDSRASFITKISAGAAEYTFSPPDDTYRLAIAKPEDTASILDLNEKYIIRNPGVVSRYKNERFFTDAAMANYFNTWINYCLNKDSAYVAVTHHAGKVVGFFIFERRGQWKESPLFKGILCAIDKEYHGKKLHLAMQSFLFNQFMEEHFYLDNTTQVSNYPILKNHIRSGRRLQQLSLTFLLKHESNS